MTDLFEIKKPPRTTGQFIAAIRRILTEKTWTQHSWYRNDRNKGCEKEEACKACLEGAFDLVAASLPRKNTRLDASAEALIERAREAINGAVRRHLKRKLKKSAAFTMVYFNDRPTTTFKDVDRVLQSAERAVKKAA